MSGFGDRESSSGAGAGETGKKMDVLSETTSSGFESGYYDGEEDEEEVEYIYELLELARVFLKEHNLVKDAICETDEERKVTMEYKIDEYHTKRMSLVEKIESTDISALGFDGRTCELTKELLDDLREYDIIRARLFS